MLGLLKGLFGSLGSWLKAKAERKMAIEQRKTALEVKKLEIVEKKETADIEWDQLMAEGSKESWKDEYWTIVLSIPAILVFFPGMTAYIKDGFTALNEVPEWYRIALGTAIAAAFGRNEIIKWFKGFKG